jgi:hypothetical protein
MLPIDFGTGVDAARGTKPFVTKSVLPKPLSLVRLWVQQSPPVTRHSNL